ncbi:phosphatase PAP2 family protein [Prauserella muralis]|uniref:Uncharacterized protein n=1 Tax=Prauserella muralis TaxID=588067 RepID=A0A2V4BFG0_9PSEU|nr:phosphatase PAP2 family protein [Prauserella muralis]PXY32789.1 hypothetical protein BAY60_07190 [Prauserella muralis]TWE13464.1 undecaprenyl-diphosphatase [Prauserella muralis]
MSGSETAAPAALPPALRVPLGIVACLAALVVIGLGGLYAGQATASGFDGGMLAAAGGYAAEPSPVRTLALMIDFGGEPLGAAVLVAALAGLCLALGRRRLALLALAGPALAVVATTLLKPVAGRTINGGHLSYPSGHTALLTAVAIVLALLLVRVVRAMRARWVALALVLALGVGAGAAMGWSQSALNAHYPTDTIGGLCTAFVLVPLAGMVIDRVASVG